MNRISFRRFYTSVLLLKGLNGLLELLGAGALLLTTSVGIQKFVYRITSHELTEDPTDVVARVVLNLGQQLGAARLFGVLYLLLHGVVKICIVYFLFKEKIKVYPWAIGALSLFTAYQIYLAWQHFSWALLGLACLDAIIVVMSLYEYRTLTRSSPGE